MFEPELDFLTQFKLSRAGMVLEIKDELNIIRWAMSQSSMPDVNADMIDKIIVTSLRKLLFENQHASVLLEICPEFKMPPLEGELFRGEDKLVMILPPYSFVEEKRWVELENWKDQKIAYFDKTVNDLPDAIPTDTFKLVLNKLKGSDRTEITNLFCLQTIIYEGDSIEVFERKNKKDENSNEKIFYLLTKAGYYHLSIYDFIKHISDKRGAHIDFEIAPLIKMMNCDTNKEVLTAIQSIALLLIYAIKYQIPEFSDYTMEKDELAYIFKKG